jgi:hypothetical protein
MRAPTDASGDEQTDALMTGLPTGKRTRFTTLPRLLVIALCTYTTVCVAVWFFQAKLIYFPSHDYRTTPADAGLAFENLTIETSDGVAISGWYVPHSSPNGTILFFHGNAGNISDRLVGIKEFYRLSYNVLIIDYRGYGLSAGTPSEQGTYLDAQAAWAYLTRTRGELPKRIALFGRSLGGAVAIDLASRLGEEGPAALVVESTFASLASIGQRHYPFLPIRWLITHRYDSIGKVDKIKCPKLFLHGVDDELIPIANARLLFEAAASPKRFIETPGVHNSSGFTYSSEYSARLAVFLYRAINPNVP